MRVDFKLDEVKYKQLISMMQGMTSAVIKKAIAPQTRIEAKKVLKDLQAKVPVRKTAQRGSNTWEPGRLKRATKLILPKRQKYKNFVAYKVGTDLGTSRKDLSGAFYAWWLLEYGSKNYPATGLMSKTLEQHRDSASKNIINKAWDRIQKEWTKR